MGTTWVLGSELSRGFYREVIRPLLGSVPHSAGLLDVLDDPRVFRRTASLYADADHRHDPMDRSDVPRPADGQLGPFG